MPPTSTVSNTHTILFCIMDNLLEGDCDRQRAHPVGDQDERSKLGDERQADSSVLLPLERRAAPPPRDGD